MMKEEDSGVKALYNEWLDQENIKPGGMLGADYETGMVRIPNIGIMVVQKTTDRSVTTLEGHTELPPKLNAIIIHEGEMDNFIRGIFVQMGPEFMFGLIGKEFNKDDYDGI
jgi:hypothetical protein